MSPRHLLESHCLVTYEDRRECYFGVQLLLLSLSRHLDGHRLPVFIYHRREVPDWFVAWLQQARLEMPVELCDAPAGTLSGWNVKPVVLLDALAKGFRQATWLDADLIVNRSFPATMARWAGASMLVASQPGVADARRSTFLGLERARDLPTSLNSCLVQVGEEHTELLRLWMECMRLPQYREIQARGYYDRPDFMIGDQDVLIGILCSTRVEDDLVRRLGFLDWRRDVLHFGAVGVRDLLRRWRGLHDFLIHAQSIKPWHINLDYHRDGLPVRMELSPYLYLARRYRAEMECGVSLEWLDRTSSRGRWCRRLTGNHPTLRMLPHLFFSGS